jgi:hypothetical protein
VADEGDAAAEPFIWDRSFDAVSAGREGVAIALGREGEREVV